MTSSSPRVPGREDGPTRLYVDGAWRDASDAGTFAVFDPATSESLCTVADATPADGSAAADAALAAFDDWRSVSPRDRSDLLRRAFDALIERQDELALLLTLEVGKPLAEARGEVAYAAAFLRWYSEEAVRIDGRFATSEAGAGRVLTMRRPVGPCLLVTPWNLPLAMAARKIAPALASGCTCVVKPAAQTPLSTLVLAEIFETSGLPPGVLNVVPTTRPGPLVEPLLRGGRIRKLSFTGSTAVGRRLIAQSAHQVLRLSMELGGNAPVLVFEDADLDAAVDGALAAKMRNAGQTCTSANRLLVHASVAEAFAERLVARMEALTVGAGSEAGTDVGPLVDEVQLAKVTELVGDAVARGATVQTGGNRLDRPGWFYAPTVLTGVPDDARVLSEEIFGPVAPVVSFTSEAEVIARCNATEYGLVAYVFTRDLARAFRVIDGLETGMVGLNQGIVSNAGAPFGGVKQSGFGREGGPEGLGDYLETTYVAMNVGAAASPLNR